MLSLDIFKETYTTYSTYYMIVDLSTNDVIIFSRQVSLARQAFLITPLHGARYKRKKNAYVKK